MNRHVTIVLFDGFELLDVFGPAELLGFVPDLTLSYVGPSAQVASSTGVRVVVDELFDEVTMPDILLVPGGAGTRELVTDESFVTWLRARGEAAALVTSVCTGSALLAAAGLLDGYQATSNKRSFDWASGFGRDVDWIEQARWIHDRDRWTSSGIAAGMDMTAALIADLYGQELADQITRRVEYSPQRDSAVDPFSRTKPTAPSHER